MRTIKIVHARWQLLLRSLPLLLLLLLLLFLLSFFFNHSHLNSTRTTPTTPSPLPPPNLSLFIGILTLPDAYSRRHFLRLIYGVQHPTTSSPPNVKIDVKFVFCNLTKQEQNTFVSLEILRFDDIIILDCVENMNTGKTYTFFSSHPSILPRRYDYVMKADDDTFIRLARLTASLKPLPRTDLYYGFVIPCDSKDPFFHYMSGMGYVLSWDLVEWIATSDTPRRDVVGPEDKIVGKWLTAAKKARNRYTEKPGMYDYPVASGRCSHELIPETVAVHSLKSMERWLEVLRFFNFTYGLRSSKSYHFD